MSNETALAALIASLTGLSTSAASFLFGRRRRSIDERAAEIKADGAAVDVVVQALEALRSMGGQLNDALATIDQLRQHVREAQAEARSAMDDAGIARRETARCQAERDIDRMELADLRRRMLDIEGREDRRDEADKEGR